ncbi:MAG: adenylate/guanylate cyclase domain-containing protein [Cyanobacteria bacterium J06634_5]
MPNPTSPAQNEIQRSLAAIVITDAVGFSRRMSQDEDAALAMINQDLQLISVLCHRFGGSILKTTGDGALMYFISAVQAVSCAIEIQARFSTLSETEPVNQHFVHRIGIHLGDIFFNNGDIMGSAVNITARLEAEAKPGSICMSQVVYEVVKSRLSLEACYAGELSLKNIEEYVSAYHITPEKPEKEKASEVISEMTVPFIVPLNNTLKALSVHPESHRIKKLLLTARQGNEEESETLLAGTSLKRLLEAFTESNSTLCQCQASLTQAANILGQTEEYFAVADIIVKKLQDFYGEYEDIPQLDIFDSSGPKSVSKMEPPRVEPPRIEPPKIEPPRAERTREDVSRSVEPPSIEPHFFERRPVNQPPVSQPPVSQPSVNQPSVNQPSVNQPSVSPPPAEKSAPSLSVRHQSVSLLHVALANRLEQDDNRIQIKKLLYCVCCGQWEKDCDRIESIPMLSIIQELYKQVDSLVVLQQQLKTILTVHELEEPFRAITHKIISECSILYEKKHTDPVNTHGVNKKNIQAHLLKPHFILT